MLAWLDRGDRKGAVRPLYGAAVGQARQGSQPRLPPPTGCGSTCPRSPTDLVPCLPPAPGSVSFSQFRLLPIGGSSAAVRSRQNRVPWRRPSAATP
jgi:hypothetical protein